MKVLNHLTPYELNEQTVVSQDIISPVDYFHRHRELQIAWIKEGSGSIIIGNCVKKFQADDIYIIGANQPHIFRSSDGIQSNIKLTCLYIDPQSVFSDMLELPEMETIGRFLKLTSHGLKVPKDNTGEAIVNMLKVCSSIGLDRLLNFIYLLKYFSQINNWNPLSSGPYNYSYDVTERLNLIYNYTLNHYMEDVSLEKIASVACMTPNAFCSYFKKYTLRTYLSFLNELRISEACKRLVSNEFKAISSVAYAVGFSNIITFNRVFRKAMGMTPSEYIDEFAFGYKKMKAQ